MPSLQVLSTCFYMRPLIKLRHLWYPPPPWPDSVLFCLSQSPYSYLDQQWYFYLHPHIPSSLSLSLISLPLFIYQPSLSLLLFSLCLSLYFCLSPKIIASPHILVYWIPSTISYRSLFSLSLISLPLCIYPFPAYFSSFIIPQLCHQLPSPSLCISAGCRSISFTSLFGFSAYPKPSSSYTMPFFSPKSLLYFLRKPVYFISIAVCHFPFLENILLVKI